VEAVTPSPSPATRAIEAVDVYRFYHAGEDETLALRGVSVHVDLGEMLALLGPSGSGKSTLLACLAGLDEPDGGYVLLRGQRLSRRPEAERAARRGAELGILLQSGNLLEHLSVEDNVALPMRLAGAFEPRRREDLLAQLGLLERRHARPSELSGGEAARAGLAVALACAPTVVLADEPTGEVDASTEDQILDVFDEHRRAGGALIVATHSEALAARADRVIRLLDGRVVDA
jgi:putative ABC transport system ATP-binding protein